MTPSSDLIDFLESEALTDEQIELSLDQMEQAAQLSQSGADASQQWQLYLHALALAGFKQWIEEWTAELEIDDSRCSIAQPNQFIAVHHLFVAKFNLCLIAAPTLLNPTIHLPKAIVDLRRFTPHIYVLIEVQEEQMQVKVSGYLRRDRLFEQQQSYPLKTVPNEMYAVPLDWFNLDPTALLLELRCLKPYPVDFLPQPPRVINVRHWLSDRLDDLASELGWRLMPPIAAAALRSAQQELSTLEIPIPPQARGAYQEVQLGRVTLRLQAAAWVLSAASETFEWTLLITVSGDRLPLGTCLRIRDDTQLLFEQTVERAEATALFAQVGGDLSERFWVTIDQPDGSAIGLPPFCFEPDFAA
ncbi:DUF1822 family protein [Oculatella sp. LEGE 06141]|uniref:DUF1822 family protein n=1 Tax=Oculatella sp. LEGE 06141 TaxID=1828648 RepID=UPI001880569B|nr:DUF1822 family protein [Oculatella sp. LEGE 06141]MBE9182946.1 DUF1822 family protein [Oculatella sp. LEGE 06141]